MKLPSILAVALGCTSCSLLTTDQADPYRMIPRGREVRIESTATSELVCAEVGESFYFVAREARGSTDPGPWLTNLEYTRWADLDRNGRLDAGEPRASGTREGPLTSFFFVKDRDPLADQPGPHWIKGSYVAKGRVHRFGPYRLP